MFLCECACAKLISKANFNLFDRTDLFIRLHIMFQISFQSSKGQKSYRNFLGVRSELLLSIVLKFSEAIIVGYIRNFANTSMKTESTCTCNSIVFYCLFLSALLLWKLKFFTDL